MGVRKPTQIGFIPEKKEKRLTKKEIIKILEEKGIEFDKNASVDELRGLIPEE